MHVKIVILRYTRAIIRKREAVISQRDIIILPHLFDFSGCLIASQSIICSPRAIKSPRHVPRDLHMGFIPFDNARIAMCLKQRYRTACRRSA